MGYFCPADKQQFVQRLRFKSETACYDPDLLLITAPQTFSHCSALQPLPAIYLIWIYAIDQAHNIRFIFNSGQLEDL